MPKNKMFDELEKRLTWRIWLYIIPAALFLAALLDSDKYFSDFWSRTLLFGLIMIAGWALIEVAKKRGK